MAAKRPVEQKDLLNFHFLARPSFSPDGTRVAYMVHRANLEKNGYDSNLWLCDLTTKTAKQITFSNEEKFFSWNRCGRGILFASGRGDLPKDSTRIFYLPMAGGEAKELFTIPHRATDIRSLGNDRYLLTVIYDSPHPNPEEADYYVFEQVPFMANGKGFIGQRRNGLAIYDRNLGELKRLTPEHMDVARYSISDDEQRLLILASDFTDLKPSTNHVYQLELGSGELSCLSEGLTFGFKWADYRGDGVLVIGCDQKSGGVNQNVQFFLLKDRQLQALTPELDSSLHNSVGCDCRYGLSDQMTAFALDDGSAVYCSTDGFVSRLHRIDFNSGDQVLTRQLNSVDGFDWCDGAAAVVGLQGLQLQELYLVEDGQEVQLTHHNDALLEELELSQPQHVTVDNGQGWALDGWYMKPYGYQEGKKYPTILHIHGGPKSAFGDVYFHEMQCWAAKGYAVIYTNPRGSDGRTGGFDDIRGFYGVKDYHDIMVFTEWCVQNLPFVDGQNLGVTGGSYGGYMTNWIVTHTDRFKAAVAQRSISNWVSKFGSCDIGYYYVEDQHLGTPWKNVEQPWEDSPLKHAANAKTPLLLIQSDQDYRCEMDQAFQMFTAMKVLGVECKLCLFKGENHELSRSGRPRNRLARLREILQWFQDHLDKVPQ